MIEEKTITELKKKYFSMLFIKISLLNLSKRE